MASRLLRGDALDVVEEQHAAVGAGGLGDDPADEVAAVGGGDAVAVGVGAEAPVEGVDVPADAAVGVTGGADGGLLGVGAVAVGVAEEARVGRAERAVEGVALAGHEAAELRAGGDDMAPLVAGDEEAAVALFAEDGFVAGDVGAGDEEGCGRRVPREHGHDGARVAGGGAVVEGEVDVAVAREVEGGGDAHAHRPGLLHAHAVTHGVVVAVGEILGALHHAGRRQQRQREGRNTRETHGTAPCKAPRNGRWGRCRCRAYHSRWSMGRGGSGAAVRPAAPADVPWG
jgi:hypothetical protein